MTSLSKPLGRPRLPRLPKRCKQCDKPMAPLRWEGHTHWVKRLFCSRQCQAQWQAKDFADNRSAAAKRCKRCGTLIIGPKPSHVGKRAFCSRACFFAAKKASNPTRRPCVICGEVPVGRVFVGQKTCSAKCGYLFRKQRLRTQRPCKQCGLMFWPVRYRLGLSKFCSKKCQFAWMHLRPMFISTSCARCGITFRRTAAAIKRQKQSFCSKRCQSLAFRGSGSPLYRGPSDPNRGGQWRRLSAKIRERDGYRCQRCNRSEAENKQKLSVDHIVPWRSFEDKNAANNPTNLVSLCRKCHSIKTTVYERLWLKGDRIGMEQYRKAIQLPPLFAHVERTT